MELYSKPTEVTLEGVIGVVTEIQHLGIYIEIKDSIFFFSQLQDEYGKQVRFTKEIQLY